MNRRIEVVKKKRQIRASEQALTKKAIESQNRLEQSIKSLYELIDSQEQYDYDKIHRQLVEIDKRLDIAPLFKSLEKSLRESSHHKNDKTKIDGFSELLKAVKNIKTQVNVKAVDVSQEYKASDVSSEAEGNFFGFLHPTGKWYILRQTGAKGGILRYTTGTSNYSQGWTSRARHEYVLYSKVSL